MDEGTHSRNTLYVLLGVWLAIAAFAITTFAILAARVPSESALVAPLAAASVYTLVVIGYVLLRQWRALEHKLHIAEVRAVMPKGGDVEMTFAVDPEFLQGVKLGDSIASNGCCLTVTKLFTDAYCVDVSRESLANV